MSKIRVLIADDHTIVRQGLRHVCEHTGGFEVVADVENGQEAVKVARELKPDVILMDVNMPVLDGVQATSFIVEADPSMRLIILTMFRQDRYVFEAIKAGARGYLLKDVDEQDLVDAIKAVYRGDALVNPSLAANLLEEFRRLSQADVQTEDSEGLTQGEMDVLRLVAQGEDNRAVAERLVLSERTVANRLSTIYEKLHVNNRTQATLVALRRGWVQLDQEE